MQRWRGGASEEGQVHDYVMSARFWGGAPRGRGRGAGLVPEGRA